MTQAFDHSSLDRLRLEVAPDREGGFQVLVYVNDTEMTSAGAGVGMDPYVVLIPTNRLIAADQPRRVPIAKCACGEYGCAGTDITITRSGEVVSWEWSRDKPMDRSVHFTAADYDAEVVRAGADYSWETPERTVGRLVLSSVNREHLHDQELRVAHLSDSSDEHFSVELDYRNEYQIWVETPWLSRTPEQLAEAVCQTLAQPPATWKTSWRAITESAPDPPDIAGTGWRLWRPVSGRRNTR